MQLHTLVPITKKKRPEPVGRGGRRGKTSGHGAKGQAARAGHKIRPNERDLIKKIPKRRGYGKNRSRTVRTNRIATAVVALSSLETAFAAGETVSPAALVAKGLVRRVKGRAPSVKIVGSGGITKALVINRCAISETARAALLGAGGSYYA